MRLTFIALLAAMPVLTFTPSSARAQDTRPEFVIAVLGDSYASGEGAPDVHGHHSLGGDLTAIECAWPYPPCYSEKWWSPDSWFSNRRAVFPQQDDPGWEDDARRCHRSSKGPGAHAAMAIATRFPDIKITVLDFACGGAKIVKGLLYGWTGPEPPLVGPDLPSQLEALEEFTARTSRKVDAIVMNIGGNDARFADLVGACVFWPFDCSGDPLLKEVGEIVKDGTSPDDLGDPKTPLNIRYKVLDAVIRNVPDPKQRAEISGLVKARPDEVYLTGLPNPSRAGPPDDSSAANPKNYCDGTQSNDFLYRGVTLGEAVALETISAICVARAL